MSFETATIVLVGLCNGNSILQTLIGTVIFRKDEVDQLEPLLIDIQIGEDNGTPKNPFKPSFQWKRKGQYGISFPVNRCHGVLINLDVQNNKYRFITGTNRGDSGSGGPISHGGPELASILDALFFKGTMI